MLGALWNMGKSLLLASVAPPIAHLKMMRLARDIVNVGLKPIRGFIDSHFRPKVIPEPGSVLYCDLWVAAEHSGIYAGDGQIVNIVVTGLAESQVKYSHAADFTSKSKLGRRIYVSCRGSHAVGDDSVAHGARSHIGEQAFYGLVFKNCHEFSAKCLHYSGREAGIIDKLWGQISGLLDVEWEPTIRALKSEARNRLGADKWLLWDWQGNDEREPEPDWQANQDFFEQQPLNPQFIDALRQELVATEDYLQELADEDIPADIRQRLAGFRDTLNNISVQYEKVKGFLQACPDAQLSYRDIQQAGEDFQALAQQLQNNQVIKTLAHKMGRAYVAEEVKKRRRVPQADRSEVHGTHRSGDVLRMLPSELANIDDEDLQMLFYARLVEQQLQTYELSGTHFNQEEYAQQQNHRTGPVVVCLDTSGSMGGEPLLKAKAALLAIANILKREQRIMYVLLFGHSGQLLEFELDSATQIGSLLAFMRQGFNGGTDYDTPMNRALTLIRKQQEYAKADVLMLSDGDCRLSEAVLQQLEQAKQQLECRLYSVLCNGIRTEDDFSDEVVVL